MNAPPDSTPPPVVADLVSTIIPVHNRADMIGEAVESVLAQTHRPIEIILVDDGSTDATWAALQGWEARHPGSIRAVRRENGGAGLARETGRLLARGEFIQYLDSDDLLLPEKFALQVGALRAHPGCAIAYGKSRLIDARGNTLLEVSKWTGRKYDTLFPALLVDRWWHTHTPLYRRSLCDQIGPWCKPQPEDWDYDARAGALGARLAFCDAVVSCQRVHDGPAMTKWSYDQYLPQEAGFLPRLHACAIRAGVPAEAPEMRHFVRWAFSLSRRTALRGMTGASEALLELARRAHGGFSLELALYRLAVRLFGQRAPARCVERVFRLPRLLRRSRTLPASAGWRAHGNPPSPPEPRAVDSTPPPPRPKETP